MVFTGTVTYQNFLNALANGLLPGDITSVDVLKTGHPHPFEERTGTVQYRIFRETSAEALTQAIRDLPEGAFLVVANPLDLRRLEYEGPLICAGFIFCHEVLLAGAKFHSEVDFSHAVFLDRADVASAEFNMDAGFQGAAFWGISDFNGCQCFGLADFRQAEFKKSAAFRKSVFHDRLEFSKTVFHDELYFDGARFADRATFVGAKFSHLAYFDSAVFAGQVDFRSCRFNGKVVFADADFQAQAYFMDIITHETADFKAAHLHSWADFSLAQFKKPALFTDMHLQAGGVFVFKHTIFYEPVEFSLQESLGKIMFDKTDIRQEFHLPIDALKKSQFEPLILRDSEGRTDIAGTEENFRLLQKIYRSTDALESELDSRYHFKRYENLRQNAHKPVRRFLRYFLLDLTSRYFTDWARVLTSMAITFGLFFGVYCLFPDKIMLSGRSLAELAMSPADFFRHIAYFSMITFTTIGYGDIHPTGFVQILAGIEGFIGIFLNSVFVVTLAKRILG